MTLDVFWDLRGWRSASPTSPRRTKVDPKLEASGTASAEVQGSRRIIKRYSNRKLYDTQGSRYVTLLQIAEMVRAGEEVQIIDNNTKGDLTEVTLAQIIYEEQKAHARNVPLQTLKEIILTRTEKVLAELRDGPIGRLIPGGKGEEKEMTAKDAKEQKQTLVDQAKGKLEEVQHQVDDRVRSILTTFRPFQQLQHEVRRLGERVDELERKLNHADEGAKAPPPKGQ
jgi:polyhydroxyalkanoate synthesis repressor PhaR